MSSFRREGQPSCFGACSRRWCTQEHQGYDTAQRFSRRDLEPMQHFATPPAQTEYTHISWTAEFLRMFRIPTCQDFLLMLSR
jgi:hypothetical protein